MIRCTLFSCSQRDLIMNRLVSGWRFFVFWLLGSAVYSCFTYISGKDVPWWLLVFGIVALGMDWRQGMEAGSPIRQGRMILDAASQPTDIAANGIGRSTEVLI